MEFTPLRQIGRRFTYNIERVEHLLLVYDTTQNITDLRNAYKSDILRSAVVMLHAALEDVLRELIRAKAAQDPGALYKQLTFPGINGDSKVYQKIEVADLDRFKDLTVSELIQKCIDIHLAKRSFNNKADLISAILAAGLSTNDYSIYFDDVSQAIARRHKIVHEGDRDSRNSKTHGKRKKISRDDVRGWLDAVHALGKLMLNRATSPAGSPNVPPP